jgi:hypothetical protein
MSRVSPSPSPSLASSVHPRTVARLLVQVALATGLVIDGVVHLRDAVFYGPVQGPLISEAGLFRVQAVIALLLAALVLAFPRPWVWVLAALVTGSAVGAVVLYTYVDLGTVAGLPDLYEPSWGPPGKVLSAVAEGVGFVLAIIGLTLSWPARNRAPE